MDKNISTLIILLTTLLISNLQGQNLVKNDSFEDYTECPSRFNQFNLCKDWFSTGNGSTPDYFNGCGTYNPYIGYSMGTPENIAGHQMPRNGNAYSGIVLFASNKNSYSFNEDFYYREYIQGILVEKLKAKKEYTFSFYISLAESSSVYADRISICFSDTQKLTSVAPYSALLCKNKVNIKEIDFKNSEDWVEVKGIYIASGGEKFITIGLFLDDLNKKEFGKINKENGSQGDRHCYYYIDDVSVVAAAQKVEFTHHD